MKRTDLPIPEPCDADWDAMTGDDQRRFCDHCQKHVHDLSAMTESEARGVTSEPGVCVRYTFSPRTDEVRFQSRRRFLVRAAAGASLAVGLPAAAAVVRAPEEPGLLSLIWEAVTSWWADDGCTIEPGEVMGGALVLEPVPEPEPLLVMMGDVDVDWTPEPEPPAAPPPAEPGRKLMGKPMVRPED